MYYVSRSAGALGLAALGYAVWFSIVLARADSYFREATPETVARAVEISPRNTEYLTLRALQLDYEGADSSALTKKIAAVNPYSSAPRIRLGLAAELQGDSANAERWLLEAAGVDHQFEPRWTLANFYFRAERHDEFWKWMRLALEVSYGDRTPAFDLCWRVSADAGEILGRAMPDRHEVMAAYLVYLLRTEPSESRLQPRLAALLEVARRLAGYHDAADLPLLYEACDQLLAARDSGAIEVWRATGRAAPAGIFNGDFSTVPMAHGFDWQLIESAGVTHVHLSAPSGHRIGFSGQQPESCLLLRQTLNLEAGKRYRISWKARTAGMKSTGLEWRVAGQHARLLPSQDWTPGELTITAAEVFSVLELAYQRPIGEPRAEGNVELQEIRLVEDKP